MDITLRQLEYFVAVAERLSFRAAAEACFVTQPGLSIQLKELEGQLDVQLFERSRRRGPDHPGGGDAAAPGPEHPDSGRRARGHGSQPDPAAIRHAAAGGHPHRGALPAPSTQS